MFFIKSIELMIFSPRTGLALVRANPVRGRLLVRSMVLTQT